MQLQRAQGRAETALRRGVASGLIDKVLIQALKKMSTTLSDLVACSDSAPP